MKRQLLRLTLNLLGIVWNSLRCSLVGTSPSIKWGVRCLNLKALFDVPLCMLLKKNFLKYACWWRNLRIKSRVENNRTEIIVVLPNLNFTTNSTVQQTKFYVQIFKEWIALFSCALYSWAPNFNRWLDFTVPGFPNYVGIFVRQFFVLFFFLNYISRNTICLLASFL